MWMMSGPEPDWMAAVMRDWRSLALMNSNTTSAPSAFEASPACRFNSTSHAGMKSTQRRMLSRVPWAKAGARRAARMPSRPAAAATPAVAVPLISARRVMWCRGVSIDSPLAPARSGPSRFSSGFVDLLELALGPLHRVLGLHALDALGIHVGDDVLGERLGRVGRGGSRIPEEPGVLRRGPEHLERLVERGPHRVLLPDSRGADAVALLRLEPLLVVLRLVHPAEKVLRELRVLTVLHHRIGLVEEQEVGAGRA